MVHEKWYDQMLNVIRKLCYREMYFDIVHCALEGSDIDLQQYNNLWMEPPMSHSHIYNCLKFKQNMYLQAEHFDSLQEEVVWAGWVHITALTCQEYLQQMKTAMHNGGKLPNKSEPQQNTSMTFKFYFSGQSL